MNIGGFQKFSMLDYPEKLSAVIFTQGCNFCCPYCHNPELITLNPKQTLDESEIINFLKERQNKLDAVVITGGEPTLQKNLIEFISKIKDLNFLVKLDTNGSNPDKVQSIIDSGLVDYFAMDIKTSFEKYETFFAKKENIKTSLNLIKNSGINYEFRTTIVKSLLSFKDFEDIGRFLNDSNLYILQKFIPSKTLNPEFMNQSTYSDNELKEIQKLLKNYVKTCLIR